MIVLRSPQKPITNTLLKNFIAVLIFSTVSCGAKQYVEGNILKEEQYTLTVPHNWTVASDQFNPSCKTLSIPQVDEGQTFSIRLCLVTGSPSKVASERGFFHENDDWSYAGSMDMQPAEISETAGGLMRLAGKASCGITTSTGFHAAGGECYTVVLLGQSYSVVFETNGIFRDYEKVREIADSTTLVSPGSTHGVRAILGEPQE